MSSYRAIFDNQGKLAEYEDGELVWVREENALNKPSSIQVIRDIDPYRSMITGEMITGRSQHRDHLRTHNCVEVGNEKMESKPIPPKTSRREVLHRRLADMSDRDANRILKDLRRDYGR